MLAIVVGGVLAAIVVHGSDLLGTRVPPLAALAAHRS